jgi:hypothetical protein
MMLLDAKFRVFKGSLDQVGAVSQQHELYGVILPVRGARC